MTASKLTDNAKHARGSQAEGLSTGAPGAGRAGSGAWLPEMDGATLGKNGGHSDTLAFFPYGHRPLHLPPWTAV